MKRFKQLKQRQRVGLWLLGLIVSALIAHYYYKNHIPTPEKSVQPVLAAVAIQKDVPVYLSALGNVNSDVSVTVRTSVSGQLQNVYFKEGQVVKKDQLLMQIDPRPFQAQLKQYEGQLARDQALLENARIDVKRYQLLWREDSISRQVLDTQLSLVKQYEGTVTLDEGLIQNTKLNLQYTRITAPLDGRIGIKLVDEGNYVQVSDTNGLVVINSIAMKVLFSLPEDTIPQILPQVNANKKLQVLVFDRKNNYLSTCELATMDNQIDPTTGTVKFAAACRDKKNNLFPNQFVNVKLQINILKNAIVVPTAAIQHGLQGRPFVYIVNKDIVNHQNIKVGFIAGDETVVAEGLKAGEKVVVEGSDKLTDGTPVKVSMMTTMISAANKATRQNT